MRFQIWTRQTLTILATFALLFMSLAPAQAVCVDPPGDVTGDGQTNVVDVQCSILSTFFYLTTSGAPTIPSCAGNNIKRSDANCSGTTNVSDILMVASQALGEKLSSALDENVDGCADSCLTQCGDGTCGKKYGEN